MWETHSSPFPSACLIQLIAASLSDIPAYVQVSLWDSPCCFTTGSDSVRVWVQIPGEKNSLIRMEPNRNLDIESEEFRSMYSPEASDSIRNAVKDIVKTGCVFSWWSGLSSVCSEINKDGKVQDLHWLLLTVLKKMIFMDWRESSYSDNIMVVLFKILFTSVFCLIFAYYVFKVSALIGYDML